MSEGAIAYLIFDISFYRDRDVDSEMAIALSNIIYRKFHEGQDLAVYLVTSALRIIAL